MFGSRSILGVLSARSFSVIESLEDRQLLSGTGTCSKAAVAALHSAMTPAAVRAPLSLTSAATTVKKPIKKPVPKPKGPQYTISPSMVHDYIGTIVKKGPFGIKILSADFEMNVASQTLTSITGTASIAGNSITGTLTGGVKLNRTFVFRIKGKGVSFAMAGTLSKDGTSILKGSAAIAVSAGAVSSIPTGFKADGTFTAKARA